MTIAEIRIKKAQRGWTNEELARRANIPVSTVAKILSGVTRNPRQASVQALEEALESASVEHTSSSSFMDSSSLMIKEASSGALENAPSMPHKRASVLAEPKYLYGSAAEKETGNSDNTSGSSFTPPYGKRLYTIEDYLAMPDDRRVELIAGRFYDLAAPTGLHQKILLYIWKTFDTCIEEHGADCEATAAPFGVQIFDDPFTVVQPDVMIFCSRPSEALQSRAHSAPDFAAEILSPSTAFRDQTQKLYLYREAGVREVWMVSPQEQKIWAYRFSDDCEEPDEYTFHDVVPLGISGGRCSVDFSKLLKYLADA